MNNPIKYIYKASKKILSNTKYLISFIVIAVVLFGIFVLIPVLTIPGNDLLFQLDVFTFKDYALLIFLAVFMSLMIAMQVFSYQVKKSAAKATSGTAAMVPGFTAALFGTASCSSCVAAIFGVFGIGTVLFLIQYQWYIVGFSFLLVGISIYFSSVSIEKRCKC